jgi:hypothetical protein
MLLHLMASVTRWWRVGCLTTFMAATHSGLDRRYALEVLHARSAIVFGRTGALAESLITVRNEKHYRNVVAYIERNP